MGEPMLELRRPLWRMLMYLKWYEGEREQDASQEQES